MKTNNQINAIVVEDEKQSQEHLLGLLNRFFPELTIIAAADNVASAVASIERYEPQVVFMDISIKNGTGFDVLNQVRTQMPHVIFTTAFDQYAIDAFRYSAVDYLLKPIQSEKLVAAVTRCLKKIEASQLNLEMTTLLNYLKRSEQEYRIPVSTMYGFEFIDAAEILFIEAEGNYSKMKLVSGRSIVLSKKIKEQEEQLPKPMFVRIHNSYIVNVQHVKKYRKGRGGEVTLDDNSSLPVAPGRKEAFLKIFHIV